MAINSHGSNLEVVTNVQGNIVNNDEWLKTKAYIEHHANEPEGDELRAKALDDLYNPKVKVAKDKRITAASNKDLRNRNITTKDS